MAEFEVKAFDELTTQELFWIYHLRVAVFVVEQACYYQEVDTDDLIATHILMKDETNRVVAYARIIPAAKQNAVQIGRVVVAPSHRQDGLGRQLVDEILAVIQTQFLAVDTVFAQAQAYLQAFYESFGFVAQSGVYLEDGIPHLDMSLALNKVQ